MKMKKIPRCDICGKSFSRRDNLERHKAAHLSRPVYYCDVCQKGFSRKSYLKVHGRSHTGEKPYVCGICSCAFARDDHLMRHRRKQHTDKIFSHIISSVASVMPVSTSNDVNNVTTTTTTTTTANNNSSSSSSSSSTRSNISSQVSEVLSEQQKQQQKTCQSSLQQPPSERCIISNAFPVLSGENQVNYICAIKEDEDTKKLTTSDLLQIQQELQQHQQQQQLLLQQQLQQQSELQQYQPHLVLKQDIDDEEAVAAAATVVPTASAVVPHAAAAVVPSGVELSTDVDNSVQAFTTDGTNVMNIVKILPAVVATSCSGCYLDTSAIDSSNICWKQEDNCPGIITTYALPISSTKPPQKSVNCNAVPFHCSVCSKTFSRRDNLERHKLCHQEGASKQYSCEICDKAFSRKSYLKVHARIHSGERPYQCNLCGFAFSRYDHLLKHKTPTKGRRKLSCVPRADVMAEVVNNTTEDAPATGATVTEVHFQNDLQQIQLTQQQVQHHQQQQTTQSNIIQDASTASGLTAIDSQAQLTEGQAVFHTNAGTATAVIPQQATLGAHTVTLPNTPITQIFHTIQMSSTAQLFPTLQMAPATHLFTNNPQLANTTRIFTNK
ncbi:zinc finger protein 865-like [Octopus bimaculoides]|uniref:C2H2-type domain-containing protein n=1 Tax=Octopus bimaculoides TaxID=37653 RepID=A0A0L8HFK0_OCTBM|nr:zinc finger protein 865-like [Octopus bimaculoides]